jgi:ADP-ribosylglycohydrolase
MLGAIVGDMVGSIYEWNNHKSKDFPLFTNQCFFTDDTVLSCATAVAILDNDDYAAVYREFGLAYPGASYGGMFRQWLGDSSMGPYNSFGNGSAMRVSPIGWAFDEEDEVLAAAEASAVVTHSHAEGIKGAQATALAILRARKGASQQDVASEIAERFDYDISRSVDEMRGPYEFDVTCQGTVPQALRCYLEAESFEDTIRNAISMGGDSDTLAAIAGSIAEATFGIPDDIAEQATARLDEPLRAVLERFIDQHM